MSEISATQFIFSTVGLNWYHTSAEPFNWTITPQPDATAFAPVTGTTNPPDFGNDIIYAGDGADHVWAGDGNDVVYGEGGNDTLLEWMKREAANDAHHPEAERRVA